MNTNLSKINLGKITRVGAIAFATTSLSLAGTTIPSIPPAQAQSVPTCIKTEHTTGTVTQTAKVTNKCSKEYRLKIAWAFGADSKCVQLKPGYYFTSKVAIQPRRFDGVRFC